MKIFVFLLAVGAACAFPMELMAPGLPLEEREGEEFMPVIDNKEWAMVPDGDGKFHLVNVQEALNEEPENFFTPETDVIFFLFTQSNPTSGQTIINGNAASLAASNFNAAHPTFVLIHGWQSNVGSASNTVVRDALLQSGPFNVFVVDWGAGAQTINYIAARNRVGPTGTVVGGFLRFVASAGGISIGSITVAGHSLGAHVAGNAGKNNPAPNQIGVIAGLDPAGPLFSLDSSDRMAITDAIYVESHHTNTGTLGFTEPLGHANFYPNGGSSQPGCGIDVSGACAHARSNIYYAESCITSTHFYAIPCPFAQITGGSCPTAGATARMGGHPKRPEQRGTFWLQTHSASPFAQGPR